MQYSDLRFDILTAAALGVVIILTPSAGHAAAHKAFGVYPGPGLGRSNVDTSCGVAGAVSARRRDHGVDGLDEPRDLRVGKT